MHKKSAHDHSSLDAILTRAPKNFPTKAIEVMNEAVPGDKEYVPSGPAFPNLRVKAGIDWTPPKLVVSYPNPMLRKAVMTHAVRSGSVIRFRIRPKLVMMRG